MSFEYFDPKDTAIPRFYIRPVLNNFDSEKEGRPIYVDIEWIDIRVPGDPRSVYSNKVSDADRKRFSRHYQAFKDGLEEPVVGTSLRQWPMMTPAKVEEYHSRGFKTVEHVANMKDSDMIRGDREWQVKAQAFLNVAAGSADVQRLETDLLRKDQEIEALKEEIARLSAAYDLRARGIESLEEKPKRGRKPKAA